MHWILVKTSTFLMHVFGFALCKYIDRQIFYGLTLVRYFFFLFLLFNIIFWCIRFYLGSFIVVLLHRSYLCEFPFYAFFRPWVLRFTFWSGISLNEMPQRCWLLCLIDILLVLFFFCFIFVVLKPFWESIFEMKRTKRRKQIITNNNMKWMHRICERSCAVNSEDWTLWILERWYSQITMDYNGRLREKKSNGKPNRIINTMSVAKTQMIPNWTNQPVYTRIAQFLYRYPVPSCHVFDGLMSRRADYYILEMNILLLYTHMRLVWFFLFLLILVGLRIGCFCFSCFSLVCHAYASRKQCAIDCFQPTIIAVKWINTTFYCNDSETFCFFCAFWTMKYITKVSITKSKQLNFSNRLASVMTGNQIKYSTVSHLRLDDDFYCLVYLFCNFCLIEWTKKKSWKKRSNS